MYLNYLLLHCSIFSFLLAIIVECRSGGAPCRAYETLKPAHGIQMKGYEDERQYSIKGYLRDGIFGCVITAQNQLKGLLVQARNVATNEPYGVFLDANFTTFCLRYQDEECGPGYKGSVTHKKPWCPARNFCTSNQPCEIVLEWIPPATNGSVYVVFELVALKAYDQYFRSTSEIITYGTSDEYELAAVSCEIELDSWGEWCKDYCDYGNKSCCDVSYQASHCAKFCCMKNAEKKKLRIT